MKNQNKRARFLINPKAQLKIVFTVFIINLSALAILSIMLFVLSKNVSRHTEAAVICIEKSIKTETDIVDAFIKFGRTVKSDIFDVANNKIINDHESNSASLKSQIYTIHSLMRYGAIILAAVIALQILQTVFIVWYTLRLSHRISGPAHRLSNIVRSLAKKKPVKLDPLRKGDLLIELHREISILAGKLGLDKSSIKKT